MKEIEVKYRLKDANQFIKKLEQLGCKMSNIEDQKDIVYVADLKNIHSEAGSIFLRVRKNNDKVELNAKMHEKVMQSRKEVEFEVSSYEEANRFLELIGFEKWVEVKKKRVHTTYENCNVCIDKVDSLGSFVELEYVVGDLEDDQNILDKIERMAKKLEIDTTEEVHQYYDEMIVQKEAVNE